MMPPDAAGRTIDVIVQRTEFLERLLEEPAEKRTLVDQLGVSRSTVDRALRDLEAEGLVTYCDEGYAVTAVGELLARKFFAFRSATTTAKRLEPFLEWVPDAASTLPVEALSDARLTVPERSEPYAPVTRHVQALRDADHVRALLPAVGLRAMEAGHERVVRGNATHRMVVEADVAERLRSESVYADLLSALRDTGRVSVSVYDGEIPFYLGLLDGTVQIGVEDDEGVPRALVETDADEVREWARERFEEYETLARRFDRWREARPHADLSGGEGQDGKRAE